VHGGIKPVCGAIVWREPWSEEGVLGCRSACAQASGGGVAASYLKRRRKT
jgi:hypothetical protein